MKKRVFIFDGTEGKSEMMVVILKHYADVAFPLGGSECAVASRQGLLDIVQKISENEYAEINRRQRPILKSAVNWFYNDSEYACPEDPMFERLLLQVQR